MKWGNEEEAKLARQKIKVVIGVKDPMGRTQRNKEKDVDTCKVIRWDAGMLGEMLIGRGRLPTLHWAEWFEVIERISP